MAFSCIPQRALPASLTVSSPTLFTTMASTVELRSANLDSLLKSELIQLCRDHGLATYGLKSELIARLLTYRETLPSLPDTPAAPSAGTVLPTLSSAPLVATYVPPPLSRPSATAAPPAAATSLLLRWQHAAATATKGPPPGPAGSTTGGGPSARALLRRPLRRFSPTPSHSRNSPLCRWGTPASHRLHSRDQFGCSQLQHHNRAVLGVPASLPQPSPAPWPHGGCPGRSSTSGVGCTATHFPASPPTCPLQRLYTLHPRQVCNCSDCW